MQITVLECGHDFFGRFMKRTTIYLFSLACFVAPVIAVSQIKDNWKPIPGGAVILPMPEIFDQDVFNSCYAKYIKPGLDHKSRQLIEDACKRAATPKKCRDITYDRTEILNCKNACNEANLISKKIGECSTSDSI